MDKLFHPTLYNGCNYLSMLGLKVNHVSKRGHWGNPYTGKTESRLYVETEPTVPLLLTDINKT